jgi:hypothetical protein
MELGAVYASNQMMALSQSFIPPFETWSSFGFGGKQYQKTTGQLMNWGMGMTYNETNFVTNRMRRYLTIPGHSNPTIDDMFHLMHFKKIDPEKVDSFIKKVAMTMDLKVNMTESFKKDVLPHISNIMTDNKFLSNKPNSEYFPQMAWISVGIQGTEAYNTTTKFTSEEDFDKEFLPLIVELNAKFVFDQLDDTYYAKMVQTKGILDPKEYQMFKGKISLEVKHLIEHINGLGGGVSAKSVVFYDLLGTCISYVFKDMSTASDKVDVLINNVGIFLGRIKAKVTAGKAFDPYDVFLMWDALEATFLSDGPGWIRMLSSAALPSILGVILTGCFFNYTNRCDWKTGKKKRIDRMSLVSSNELARTLSMGEYLRTCFTNNNTASMVCIFPGMAAFHIAKGVFWHSFLCFVTGMDPFMRNTPWWSEFLNQIFGPGAGFAFGVGVDFTVGVVAELVFEQGVVQTFFASNDRKWSIQRYLFEPYTYQRGPRNNLPLNLKGVKTDKITKAMLRYIFMRSYDDERVWAKLRELESGNCTFIDLNTGYTDSGLNSCLYDLFVNKKTLRETEVLDRIATLATKCKDVYHSSLGCMMGYLLAWKGDLHIKDTNESKFYVGILKATETTIENFESMPLFAEIVMRIFAMMKMKDPGITNMKNIEPFGKVLGDGEPIGLEPTAEIDCTILKYKRETSYKRALTVENGIARLKSFVGGINEMLQRVSPKDDELITMSCKLMVYVNCLGELYKCIPANYITGFVSLYFRKPRKC